MFGLTGTHLYSCKLVNKSKLPKPDKSRSKDFPENTTKDYAVTLVRPPWFTAVWPLIWTHQELPFSRDARDDACSSLWTLRQLVNLPSPPVWHHMYILFPLLVNWHSELAFSIFFNFCKQGLWWIYTFPFWESCSHLSVICSKWASLVQTSCTCSKWCEMDQKHLPHNTFEEVETNNFTNVQHTSPRYVCIPTINSGGCVHHLR